MKMIIIFFGLLIQSYAFSSDQTSIIEVRFANPKGGLIKYVLYQCHAKNKCLSKYVDGKQTSNRELKNIVATNMENELNKLALDILANEQAGKECTLSGEIQSSLIEKRVDLCKLNAMTKARFADLVTRLSND